MIRESKKTICDKCGCEWELFTEGDGKDYKYNIHSGKYEEVTKDGELVGYKKK